MLRAARLCLDGPRRTVDVLSSSGRNCRVGRRSRISARECGLSSSPGLLGSARAGGEARRAALAWPATPSTLLRARVRWELNLRWWSRQSSPAMGALVLRAWTSSLPPIGHARSSAAGPSSLDAPPPRRRGGGRLLPTSTARSDHRRRCGPRVEAAASLRVVETALGRDGRRRGRNPSGIVAWACLGVPRFRIRPGGAGPPWW